MRSKAANNTSMRSKKIYISKPNHFHMKNWLKLNKTIQRLGALCIMVVTFLAMPNVASATHVVGGELKYRHIEGDRYEIILTFRRDCLLGADNAQFDNPANVWIFNGNGNLKTNLGANGRLKMNFNASDTLNQIIESDCGFEGTQVCVHETTYIEEVRLPFNPEENGYILAYQRCCRNETIGNVLDPLETGGTWTATITPFAQAEQNDNPCFNQWAPVYVCANEDVSFDHSAVDSDGDSLVYKLCTPFLGATSSDPIPTSAPAPPYTPVAWAEPFGLDDLLGGTPLQIDPETGLLTGVPNQVGQFLVGICVEEYRDGVKIGEVRRDFQYNVRICSDPPTAIFEANDGNCDGPEVQFDNQSLGATAFQWNFDYPSTDAVNISEEEDPFFEYPAPGVYDVQLIVTRGSDTCSDTIVQQVAALFSDIDVMFDLQIQACLEDGRYAIRLINRSVEPEEGFDITGAEWEITQNGETATYEGNVINLEIDPADFIVSLQAESETGCKKTDIDTIMISDFEHIADFAFELEGCASAGNATIAFGDISDAINIYDSPQGYAWVVTEASQETTFADSSFTYDVQDQATLEVALEVDFGGGCSASVIKTIDIQDLVPQAGYEIDPQNCPDAGTVELEFVSTSDLDNPDYGVDSYVWVLEYNTPAGGESIVSMSETVNVTVPKDSTVALELVVTFDNGCVDVLRDTIVPGPFANIAFDAESMVLCLGDTMPFVTAPNADFTYTWSPTEGLVFEAPYSMANPGIVGVEDTEYAVTVTDGLCTVESSVSFIVLDADNLGISGDSIVCDGMVELTASGGIGAGEFEWSLTDDFATILATGTTLNHTFDGQEQTYYVRFTGESCGDPFAKYRVILSDIFDVVFNGDPVRVCLTDTVPLLENPNLLLTYVWSPLDGIYFEDPTDGSTAMVIGISDTAYDVTISDDFCSLDTSIAVVIGDAQDFQITGDSIVCDENVELVASGASGIGTYQWSLDPDFATIIFEGDTLMTTMTGVNETYYVQFTDKTCGDLVLSYDVRIFQHDLLFFEPFMICRGDTLEYTVFNQGEGPLTWEWLDDPHVVDNANSNIVTIGVGEDENDPFEVIFVATSPTGCELRDTILFEIMDNPIVDFDFELQDCGDYTVCFDIDGTFNGFPAWDFGDTTTGNDTSVDTMPCYTYPGPGTYEVVLSNRTSLCPFDDIVKTVTINDDITIDPIDEQVICLGDMVSITATSPNIGVVFVWCNLEGDTITLGPDYSEIVNDTFQVIVKGQDPNGCFDMDTVLIRPFVFDIEDTVPEVFCESENTEIEIIVNGSQDDFQFQWGPEDCIQSGGDTGNPVLITGGSKTYSVTITNTVYGCEFVKTYDVTTTSFDIELDAIDEFGVNTDTINQTEEITIFVIDADDDYTYEWSGGSTDDELTVSPEETTTYSVTVTDEMGCTATDDITIFVRLPVCNETDVFLPSAFTPNADGINDILYLRSNFIDQMELLIYNRWGEEVFATKDQSVGWDGTFKGAKVSPDVYAYTLRVVCINQAEYAVRGNVSLMK